MYRVYVIYNLLLNGIGYNCSDDEFKQLTTESGTSYSLKEFEELINNVGFDNKHYTVRILKPNR